MHHARLAERAPFERQVDLVPATGDRALREWASDVSETGMSIVTRQPFAIGDTVTVRFDHGYDEVHIRAAEVVWVRREGALDGRPPGIGVRFLSVDPAVRATLRRLVVPVRSQPPSTSRSPTAPAPHGRVEITEDLLRPASAGPPLPGGLGASGVPTPVAVSVPPDEPAPSPAARVFDATPCVPRAVTLGPRSRSTPPAASMLPAATRTQTVARADADPFAGWTFRRADDITSPHAGVGIDIDLDLDLRATPAALRERFDDDGPARARGRTSDSVIENPTILQSTTIPPVPADHDGFALGALPEATERGFIDGALSIRHLPIGQERMARPGAAPARLSLGAATAFLVAGCCAGAVVGLLQREPAPVIPPVVSDAAGTNDDDAPPLPTVAVVEQALPPPAAADAAEADDEAAPPTTATTTPSTTTPSTTAPSTTAPSTTAPSAAAPPPAAVTSAMTKAVARAAATVKGGRLEVPLPRGGRVKKAFALSSPARVVVDVKGAALPGHLPDVAGAREVRVGRPEKGVERVVIVLEGDAKPELARAKIAGDRLVVRWRR